MASTKIINVLKDDKFEEILDLLKETSAKEVIFVLPKTSRAFKKEENFIILANEASKAGKKISLLCSNPDINNWARQYKFDVLLAKNDSKPSLITAVNQFDNEAEKDETEEDEEDEIEETEEDISAEETDDEPENIEDPEEIAEEDDDDDETEEEYEDEEEEVAVPVSVKSRGGLEGIVRSTGSTRLSIKPRKEKAVTLDIKNKISKRKVEEIQSVWEAMPDALAEQETSDGSIWSNFTSHPQKDIRRRSVQSKKLFSFTNLPKKGAVLLGAVSVLIFGSIIFISSGSAKIAIYPKKQAITADLNIATSDKFSSVDYVSHKIPGQLFNIDKIVSKTFNASGEKDVVQKARGMLTVYNNYGTTPQVLIATTRFEKDGLIFRTLKTVTVPGMTVDNGEVTPGKVSVEVVADKAGETYNISAGQFTIPAFKERADNDRYQKIYGESSQPLKGGVSGRAKVVTESDYNNAKEELKLQLEKEIDEALKLQTAGLKTLSNITIKISQPESTAKADEAAESFTMSLKGSVETVAFKENDLRELIRQNVDKTKDLVVISDKLNLSYLNSSFKETESLLEFTVSFRADAYSKVDLEQIKKGLAGKKEDDIKSYLRGISGIDSAKVILTPFWVSKIPKDEQKTLLNIEY